MVLCATVLVSNLPFLRHTRRKKTRLVTQATEQTYPAFYALLRGTSVNVASQQENDEEKEIHHGSWGSKLKLSVLNCALCCPVKSTTNITFVAVETEY